MKFEEAGYYSGVDLLKIWGKPKLWDRNVVKLINAWAFLDFGGTRPGWLFQVYAYRILSDCIRTWLMSIVCQIHTSAIRKVRVQISVKAEIWFEISAPPALRLLANSAMMSTLSVHCQWKDETERERTGPPPSYAEAKKIKSLTLHTHGWLKASVRGRSVLISLIAL